MNDLLWRKFVVFLVAMAIGALAMARYLDWIGRVCH
jgi:hypothetical protein